MTSVFDTVADIVREVVGADFLLEQEITPDTSFSQDLALESIEFVELSEKLREHFGARANLTSFFSDLDIDEIMDLTVGQLAGYVAAQLTAAV